MDIHVFMDISLQLSMLLWISIWISLDFYGYPCIYLLWVLDPGIELAVQQRWEKNANCKIGSVLSPENGLVFSERVSRKNSKTHFVLSACVTSPPSPPLPHPCLSPCIRLN